METLNTYYQDENPAEVNPIIDALFNEIERNSASIAKKEAYIDEQIEYLKKALNADSDQHIKREAIKGTKERIDYALQLIDELAARNDALMDAVWTVRENLHK